MTHGAHLANLSQFVVIAGALAAMPAFGSVSSLRYVDRYSLPYTAGQNGTVYGNTLFGGVSGLDFDPSTNTYVAISDDRSQNTPPGGNAAARFYGLSINVDQNGFVGPSPIVINSVNQMLRPDGTTFPTLNVDPEAIRFRHNGNQTSLVWTSEGAVAATSNPPLQNPFVREMNLSGGYVREFTNPAKFNPDGVGVNQTQGIRNNLAYESVTISPDGSRLYTATESALFQDGPRATATAGSVNRIVEFDMTSGAPLREFAYVTDPIRAFNPANANDNGLAEMLSLGNGEFIALERSFALNEGNSIRLYKISLAGATDVSGLQSLVSQSYTPVSKELLLTLNQPSLGGAFNPDNVEAITFGPVLPNGDQSFILAVDNNFSGTQVTQFIMIATPAPGGFGLLLLGVAARPRRRRR